MQSLGIFSIGEIRTASPCSVIDAGRTEINCTNKTEQLNILSRTNASILIVKIVTETVLTAIEMLICRFHETYGLRQHIFLIDYHTMYGNRFQINKTHLYSIQRLRPYGSRSLEIRCYLPQIIL